MKPGLQSSKKLRSGSKRIDLASPKIQIEINECNRDFAIVTRRTGFHRFPATLYYRKICEGAITEIWGFAVPLTVNCSLPDWKEETSKVNKNS